MRLIIEDTFFIGNAPAVSGHLPDVVPANFKVEPRDRLVRLRDGLTLEITGVESDLTSNPFAGGKPFGFKVNARHFKPGDEVELVHWWSKRAVQR